MQLPLTFFDLLCVLSTNSLSFPVIVPTFKAPTLSPTPCVPLLSTYGHAFLLSFFDQLRPIPFSHLVFLSSVIGSIGIFDLVKVLHRTLFLTQCLVLTRAWNQQNKAMACTPLRPHSVPCKICRSNYFDKAATQLTPLADTCTQN